MPEPDSIQFPFRAWVRRAALSILTVAASLSAIVLAALLLVPRARYGWMGEPFVWLYLGALWVGGGKIFFGSRRPVVELGEQGLTLRPLHQLRAATIGWSELRGTEQMLRGDRMIVYYDRGRGLRHVALNLNLVKGRSDLVATIEKRLGELGFQEKIVERSRYLSRG